ncbi:recombinase family protein [Alteribacter keqinensis]|uniref:recombinase family protein n=1 Tax=Alteribacter keqinensis TaxID=2483800 RepID=UPI001605D235|nr:recombinase family protein [Alteribacter keqinensis]
MKKIIYNKKGVFYGRHSTDKQEITWQQKRVEEFIALHGGKRAKDFEYIDKAVSARKTKLKDRGQLNRLLVDAERKCFEFVVISDYDRIARDPKDHLILKKHMQELGVPVFVASTGTQYGSEDFLTQLLFDGLSKFEADQTAQRTKDTIKLLVSNGKWKGGNTPYGYIYDKDTQKLLPDPLTKDKVKEIFNQYERSRGFKTISSFLSKLESDQFKADTDYDKTQSWYPRKIKSIITNPIYSGRVTLNRRKHLKGHTLNPRSDWFEWEAIECIDEPIISVDQWERCWKIYNKRNEENLTSLDTPFYLRNIIKCAHCPNKVIGKNYSTKKYEYYYYVCKNCKYKVSVDQIHLSFNKQWQKQITDQGLKKKTEAKIEEMYEREIYELECGLTQIKEGIDRINNEINDLLDKKQTYAKVSKTNYPYLFGLDLILKEKKGLLAELEVKREKQEGMIGVATRCVIPTPLIEEYLVFDSFTAAEKNDLIKLFVKSCTIYKTGRLDLELLDFSPNA